MSWLEALILGLLQGLTEFLPVSSSGHLEIGKSIFGIHSSEGMTFTIIVHFATVLSTLIVFRKDILVLFKSLFTFKYNEDNKYILKIILSSIPVIIVGLLFAEELEALFTGNILFVGFMLLITSFLLGFAHFAKKGEKPITFWHALIIGVAQAIAVIPGISRSGATIATSLVIGNKKEEIAKFSFLMVIIPVLGAVSKDIYDSFISSNAVPMQEISVFSLIIGFIAAFLTGLFACSVMIKIVKNSKLIYFAVYCLIIGLIAVGYGLFV